MLHVSCCTFVFLLLNDVLGCFAWLRQAEPQWPRAARYCDTIPAMPHIAQYLFREVCTGGRAKPGRFGSLVFAMKNRHFGGECSWILAGKARKCGRFWVFGCVPSPGKQSIWRQCPPSARKQSTKKTAKLSRFYPCTG